STDLGNATVEGTTFHAALNLPSGLHHLRVRATDALGEASPDAFFDARIDLARPTVTIMATVSPDPRATPVDAEQFTLSERIDLATLDASDIALTRDGLTVPLSGLTFALVAGTTYSVKGLARFNADDGTYVLTVNANGIRDRAGNAGTNAKSVTWV